MTSSCFRQKKDSCNLPYNMKKSGTKPHIINSISELHRIFFSFKTGTSPDQGIVRPGTKPIVLPVKLQTVSYLIFYSVWLEKDVNTKLKYGQQYFDFEEGSMIFIAPGQVLSTYSHGYTPSGWGLVFHPDFIQGYPLIKAIKGYGYFSYAVNEGLHLSEKRRNNHYQPDEEHSAGISFRN